MLKILNKNDAIVTKKCNVLINVSLLHKKLGFDNSLALPPFNKKLNLPTIDKLTILYTPDKFYDNNKGKRCFIPIDRATEYAHHVINVKSKKLKHNPNHLINANRLMKDWKELQQIIKKECIIDDNNDDDEFLEKIEDENKQIINRFIIDNFSEEDQKFLEGVGDLTNKKEIFLVNLRRIGIRKMVILVSDDRYEPWYQLKSLASEVGYSEPRNLFKEGRLLAGLEVIALENLWGAKCPSYLIDPDKVLEQNLESPEMKALYIPHKVAVIFMTLARQKSKFKKSAQRFIDLLDKIDDINVNIINKLNKVVSEYQLKEYKNKLSSTRIQLNNVLKEQENRICTKDERVALANERFPDVPIKKSYVYLISTEEMLKRNPPIFKVGQAKDLKQRISQHQGSNVEAVKVDQRECYSPTLLENLILKSYQDFGYQYRPNKSSGVEWFFAKSSEEIKKIFNQHVDYINDLYNNMPIPKDMREVMIG